MTKRNFVLIVTILAFFNADSTVRADRLFQGRIIKRLFGMEEKSPSPKKPEKKKKAKKNEERKNNHSAAPYSTRQPQSFQSKGFGLQVRAKGKRLTVVRVTETGTAKNAGVRVGDQIVKVAGANVENVGIFREIEKVLEPGNEVEVILRRAGKRESVTVPFVKAAKAPTANSETAKAESEATLSPPADPLPLLEPTPAIAPSEQEQDTKRDQSILRFPEELIP